MAVRTAPDETARRGEEIYERHIKPTLAEDQHGRYVSIDIESGCWTIADTLRGAIDELYEQRPEAADVWSLRVGHRALHHFVGRHPHRDAEVRAAVPAVRSAAAARR